MKTDDLDYDLPPELIAQRPLARRDESRLLVYERGTGAVSHRRFPDVVEELAGFLVVVNDTRVLPVRLHLERPGGGKAEVLLLEPLGGGEWEALARPTKRLRDGMRLGPVELLADVGERAVADVAGRAVVDEEAALVAALERALGDELGRKVVVQFLDTHLVRPGR